MTLDDFAKEVQDKTEEVISKIQEKVPEVADKAQEFFGQAQEKAPGVIEDVKESTEVFVQNAKELADDAGRAARAAVDEFQNKESAKSDKEYYSYKPDESSPAGGAEKSPGGKSSDE